jgi:hypothetical protein
MKSSRSPKVKQILALRGRAATLRAEYEAALVCLEPTRHRAAQLVQEARALKGTLSDCELTELRRAWSGV